MLPLRQIACFGSLVALVSAAPSPKLTERQSGLPSYALTYAPWSYVYSGEQWFPSDIKTHLANTIPEVNFVAIGSQGSATVNNLDTYNTSVYLSEPTPASDSLPFLYSAYGTPDNSTGFSAAPGTIIAVQKNATWVDVFYFYFYSYNYGGKVLDINFDDHVGDWEHTMIRFINGSPYAIYLSQHGAGSAYYWDVMDFHGSKPITYIAIGSHANYAKSGTQDYTFAGGLVSDHTDAGYAWDMSQNYRGYWYSTSTGVFTTATGASTGGSEEGSETGTWLSWEGYWGDNQYPSGSYGQYCLFGECKYTGGPQGPISKNLERTAMCQDESSCTVYDNINDLTSQSKRDVN